MQGLIFSLVIPVVVLVASILMGLLFKGYDRKFAAYYQSRIGPPILQPFYDINKLMYKQTIIPENAVRWVFKGAPFLALASSVLLVIYIWAPYFSFLAKATPFFLDTGDIILILYLLMVPAIALIAGGFASGSPYATVGAQREMVIVMATELPLAVIIITFGWKMTKAAPDLPSFSLATIAAHPIWHGLGPLGIIGGILLAFTLLVIIPAELAKIPFDQAEAETEIADGLLVEYSGKYLAFYNLAEGVKALAVASLAVIFFFPQGLETLFGIRTIIAGYNVSIISEVLFFFTKVFVITFFAVTTVRVAMARFKISQVAKLFLITLTTLSLAGFLLLALDPIIR
ncbi:MAG: NADH-quinone oxidoreductase subunit H [bacterium]|nr:NADH-quinone oxidoreductase subunit H [bacterium]